MRPLKAMIALILGLACAAALPAQRGLPRLGADPARVTVSGLSSGGHMAVQYGVAFSGSVKGVGVVAGGPYHCAAIYGLPFLLFYPTCMSGKPDGRTSWKAAEALAREGAIDPVAGIAGQRIYLFHGKADTTVGASVMDAVRAFYRAAQVPEANIAYETGIDAGHAFLAPTGGLDCAATAEPYVDTCPTPSGTYDQPGAILLQLYGPLTPPAATLSARPITFDQRPYLSTGAKMAPRGHAYVPAACRQLGRHCAVHVVFHGCLQAEETVRDAVYARVGYNRWADTNGIILLYSQVNKTTTFGGNPKGCWDWWAYTDLAYATRQGAQLKSVRAMVARLTTPR